MKRNAHDIYLVDFRLGGSDGLELIREARAEKCVGPIILLTGQGDRQTDIKAMHAGASDFITKGRIDSSQLERSIRYAIEQHRLRDELERQRRGAGALQLRAAAVRLRRFARPAGAAAHDLELRATAGPPLSRASSTAMPTSSSASRSRARKRMQNLINDLLSLSRVGTRGLELAPTDCGEVLEESLANLQAALTESGAEVTHDSLPTVMADKPQLAQLFQNLVGNALKFHSGNAPKIHISCQPNGKECTIGVKDNGIGIDPRHAERIFQVFQRLHDREKYAGTGHRPGDLQKDRRTPRRPHLGRVAARRGRDIPIQPRKSRRS